MEPAFSLDPSYAHLRKADPILGRLIERFGPHRPRPKSDPYAALLRSMLFQQLAGAAASAIQRRFFARYGREDQPPTPQELLASSDEDLRSVGISRQKATYMRDLALYVVEGHLDFDEIATLPDAEVIQRLVAVKGIGEWTAHMYLMFQLGRPDILPTGDFGVRKGMRLAYRLPGLPSAEKARVIGEPWAPYRSVGSQYMWRVAESPQSGGAS